ncbi:hypothetical protein ACOM2C_08795 [Pseudarthrobacter sp. So.54]
MSYLRDPGIPVSRTLAGPLNVVDPLSRVRTDVAGSSAAGA